MIFRTILLFGILSTRLLAAESTWTVSSETEKPENGNLKIRVLDAETDEAMPFSAIVRTFDGTFADGSGRGVYQDGRFFADAECFVDVPPGKVEITLKRGPEYLPLGLETEVAPDGLTVVTGKLHRWISLSKRGWYCGDNHVHAKHDDHSPIRTDLSYATLQARAQGLNFITEAGSNVSYDKLNSLSTRDFEVRYAGEIRPGPYVGHMNPPGLKSAIPEERYEQLIHRPLPAQAIFEEVRKQGGIVIHTHALMPRHQLHWMGASEAWSDAVSLQTADLLDVDANHTQLLWFAMLNLGNRIGVSGHTDAALGRTNSPSPGDSRVYCQADSQDYDAFVQAMGEGKTMATNGGTVFTFLDVDKSTGNATLEIQSLHKLQSAALYQDGNRVAAFNVNGQSGEVQLSHALEIPQDRNSWVVARAQDENGKWCLTSPVYFEADNSVPDQASAILLEISNATRFADLSTEFFAHAIVTVREPESIDFVELVRDGSVIQRLNPGEGNRLPEDGKIPVTGMWGNYAPGWIWHPQPENPWHLQLDHPVAESGWYSVHVRTSSGRDLKSSEMYFDAENPKSNTLSAATLEGPRTRLKLWGYGEDVEIEKLRSPLFKGSWWYPGEIYWNVEATFDGNVTTMGWPKEQPVLRFRN